MPPIVEQYQKRSTLNFKEQIMHMIYPLHRLKKVTNDIQIYLIFIILLVFVIIQLIIYKMFSMHICL